MFPQRQRQPTPKLLLLAGFCPPKPPPALWPALVLRPVAGRRPVTRAPPCGRLWFCALWPDTAPLPAPRPVAPASAATPAPNRYFGRAFAPGSRSPPCGRLWFCAQWPDAAPLPAPRPVAPAPAETHAPKLSLRACRWPNTLYDGCFPHVCGSVCPKLLLLRACRWPNMLYGGLRKAPTRTYGVRQ